MESTDISDAFSNGLKELQKFPFGRNGIRHAYLPS
jgi:hypothetical protein